MMIVSAIWRFPQARQSVHGRSALWRQYALEGGSTRIRVFDLLSHWEHELVIRPRDVCTEMYLGGSPMEIRDAFYEASPISWTTTQNNHVDFLVV